jgi:hypothetical protein
MAQVAGTSLRGLNAWDRHKRLIHDMMTYYGGKLPEVSHTIKSDHEVLRETYRYVPLLLSDVEGSIFAASSDALNLECEVSAGAAVLGHLERTSVLGRILSISWASYVFLP